MLVPLHFINEEDCVGRKAGGVITHLINEVDVTCQAKDLPEFIEVDVAALEMGELLHLSDIKPPPGVELSTLSHGDDSAVVSVQAPQAEREETDEDAEDDEAAETE